MIDKIPTAKGSIVFVLMQFPLCLQLVGLCTEHWIEGRENWFVKDEHNHLQVTWIVIDSIQVCRKSSSGFYSFQGLKRICCRSAECYGQCRRINFTDLSNGETKEMMGTWERYLFIARENSILLKIGIGCCAFTTILKIIFPRKFFIHSIMLTIAGLFGFLGLTVFLAVTEKYRASEYDFGVSFYSVMLGVLLEGLVALVLLQDRPGQIDVKDSEYSASTSCLTTIPNSSLTSPESSAKSSGSKEVISSTESLTREETPYVSRKRSVQR